MWELFLVFAIFVGVAGLAMLALLSVNTLLIWGGGVFAVGMLVGVSAGLRYHLLLYRVLRNREDYLKDWVWKPYVFHDSLSHDEKRHILPWWYAGGMGFLAVVVGGIMGGVAIVRVFLENSQPLY